MYNMIDIRKMLEIPEPTQVVQKTGGLMRRAARDTVEEDSYDPSKSILAHIRTYQEGVEDFSTTNALEESQRPRSRAEGGFDTPVRTVFDNTFQERLGVDSKTSDTLTRAFLINFQDESGMVRDRLETTPNVHGTRGKGYYQLTGDRRDSFESVYGADGYTDQNQAEFLVKELLSSEKSAGKAILSAAKTGDVGETAAIIVDKFLRPAEKHRVERMSRYRSLTNQ